MSQGPIHDTAVVETSQKFTHEWYSRSGFVYFVSAGCLSCMSIKIGVSSIRALSERLRGIQSSNPSQIHLLRLDSFNTMKEAEARESELHMRFKELARVPRWTAGCEWFRAAPELMEYIQHDATPLHEQLILLDESDRVVVGKLFIEQ